MSASPPEPPPLYAIADASQLAPLSLAEGVRAMASAGVRWIQLRAKALTDAELWRQATAARQAATATGAALWINDRADLALAVGAAGIHVGQSDMPPAAVRKVVGDRLWIGQSTHNEAQLLAADADPAVDVVAVGPVFSTTGKVDPDPVVGLELVRRARRLTAKPLVAIGGIDVDTAASVLAAGADSAVVLGAACRAPIEESCRRLLAAVEGSR